MSTQRKPWIHLLGALAVYTVTGLCAEADAQELVLNAFGDVNYGQRFGDPAKSSAASEFESFGEDVAPKSAHSGFGLVGTDFVLSGELPDDFVYLGEVNLQVARGGQSDFEVDVERMFIEKRFKPQVNLQAGLFFTPIGYFNRTLYSRAFLMNSIQIPDLFEEELGLVPTHTVGAQLYGEFQLGGEHRLGYAVSWGNGRAMDPVANVYARDDDGWRSVTAMVEWWMPWFKEGRFGISGWYDRIKSYRVDNLGGSASILDPAVERIRLRELGVNAHLLIKSDYVNVMLEGVHQRHDDDRGNLPDNLASTSLTGFIGELSANLGPDGAIKPYVRYDYVSVPANGGPYLGLRLDGTDITHVYIADTSMLMLGAAWDVAMPCRLKLEYSLALSGPREQHSIVAQSSFAF